MPLRIRDRVKQRTLTVGTGTITFSSSLSSFQDFSGVLSDGDLTYYTIQNTSQFEVGQATYSGNTLDRGQVFVSSSGSSRIYLNQEADVFITYPASKAVFLETENNITGVDAFDFNTGVSPSYKQGRIFYDTDNGALSVYNDEADITLQVGQEEYLRARNETTGVILNGEAVRVLGSQGNSVTITKAIATGSLQSQCIGLATHDIESNSFGYVAVYGVVRDLDTSDFIEGSEVYLSDEIAGGLTGVSPVAPSYKTSIGHIIRSHPSVGSILVTPRAEKLGGPDVKSTNGNNIGVSGVTFVELLTNEGAAILASNTGMVYDSGNQILEINAGGIKYPDGNTQTIAYTGQGASLTGDYATTSYVNSVSGNLQTQITSNDSDIAALQTATGLLDTDVQLLQTATGLLEVRVAQNETDISSLETATGLLDTRVTQNETDITGLETATGLLDTRVTQNETDITSLETATGLLDTRVTQNETDITSLETATGLLETRVTQNETDITALETATGLLDTRVTQNESDITSVSGLLYNNWNINVTGNIDSIESNQTVIFTGIGLTSVEYNESTNTVTISGAGDGGGAGGGYDWNISVTGLSDTIASGETVVFTGLGNTSLFYNAATNTISISGADQDLSSYATTSFVDSVSGNLQSEIDSNDTDISTLQTATGLLETRVTQNETDITALETATGLLDTRVTQNETDITTLETATGLLDTRVAQNETDITALETATGLLDTRVTQNDNDIDSVSGLLYNYWVLRGDGATTTNVDSTEQVQFKGAGSVSVSLGGTDNREVTISGIAPSGGGMTNWGLSVTGDSTSITQGETVTFSGQGNVIASRSGNFVIITGVDQDLSSYATTSFVNSVSGNLQSEIDSNDTDISALQTATGLLETRVTQNETDITALETATGLLDTRVTQNESDINSVSGLLYNNWNINVTGNIDSITSNQTVLFTGIGNTSVKYDSSSNIVSISGADQDLSSYATTGYVNSVSGNLQGEIDSNDTDISALQTATGLLETRVTQNETDITALETATGLLDTRVTQNTNDISSSSGYLQGQINTNDTDISNLQTATGLLETRVTQNELDITDLETATGNLDTRVTQNANDISSVSGLLYNNWNVNVTGNIDSITSNETVLFTGVGNTSVAYNSSTNTVSISGGGGGTTYTAGSGLTLVGTEFNTADTGLFERIHFYNGSIQIGKEAKVYNNTDTSVAIGNYAAKNLEPFELYILGNPNTWSTGLNGIYIGYKAGQGSDGVGNTYIGYQAASGFISPTYKGPPEILEYAGSQNCIGIGVRALYQTSGTLNASDEPVSNIVAIGYNAAAQSVGGLTDLVAIGAIAGFATTDVDESTFIGYGAGGNASGIRNVAIGYNSFREGAGTNNIEIITYRTNTASVIAGYDNKIHIENTIIGDTSSKLIAIGNVGTSDVVPDATLEIKPNLSTDIGLIVQGAASHSVNLQEWQDSSENILAFVDTRGAVSGSGFIFQDGTTQTTAGSSPTGTYSGVAYFGSDNSLTETINFTISDSGKVYAKTIFGNLDDQGNQSGTITFNANESNFHLATLTGNSTLAITGEDIGQKILIRLKQDGVGGHTVNWWNNIKWAEGGTEPTLTTTSEKADMFGFIVTSGVGPYFYDGFIVGQNI